MINVIASLVSFVVAALLTSACILGVRTIIAIFTGDETEFRRLTTPYDEAERMAISRFGVTAEEFEKTMDEELERNPKALPLDAYWPLMEKYTIL